MQTNTIRHVSDESKYKIFNPQGTAFPANIVDVQSALAALSPQAVNGIPEATQITAGISRFATDLEVEDGTSTTLAISPSTLKTAQARPQATTTVVGVTRYATDAETTDGVVSNAAIVPSSLKIALDANFNKVFARQATELVTGVAKISTTPAAIAGTDDTTIMTPKKTLAAINNATSKISSPDLATTTAAGLVRIALAGEVQAGTLNNGVAVSPLGLSTLISTTARRGLIQLATAQEVATGTVTDKAVSPSTLLARTGTEGRLGVVKTTRTVGTGDANTALAYNADVVHTRGGQTIAGTTTFSGRVNAGSLFIGGQQAVTVNMLTDDVPVGVIMMWASTASLPAKWRDADGWAGYIGNASYAALQRVYPSGLPDMRGLFVRGIGQGRDILAQQGKDSKGQDRLGVNAGGANSPGLVQAQMVRRHKHNSGWGEHHNRTDSYFGATMRNGFRGNNGRDSDNYLYFTNDGSEYEANTDAYGTMNPEGLMGFENRPWNMSVRYIIKVQ